MKMLISIKSRLNQILSTVGYAPPAACIFPVALVFFCCALCLADQPGDGDLSDWQQGTGAARASQFWITTPSAGVTLDETTRIEVELGPMVKNVVERVEFFANGQPIGVIEKPPFYLNWMPGEYMLEDTLIEVHAMGSGGRLAVDAVTTRAIRIDYSSEVRLVEVYATITDRQGDFVDDLIQDDFRVLEDGRAQEISYFSSEIKPVKLVMLIDCSQSMGREEQLEEKFLLAQTAASRFAETVRPEDRFAVMGFHDDVFLAHDFSNEEDELKQEIGNLRIGRGTALYDSIYRAVGMLGTGSGRKAILLLSDGRDESFDGLSAGSFHTFEEAMEHALKSDVAVYVIGLGKDVRRRSAVTGESLQQQLQLLAGKTGASAFFPRRAGALAGFYGRIAEELKHQYSLYYTSNNQARNNRWRKIKVAVKGRGLRIRAREGYYASR